MRENDRVHDYPGPRRDRDQIPAGFLNRDRWSRRVFLAGNAPSAYARHNLIAKKNLQKKKWRPRGRPSRQTVKSLQINSEKKQKAVVPPPSVEPTVFGSSSLRFTTEL